MGLCPIGLNIFVLPMLCWLYFVAAPAIDGALPILDRPRSINAVRTLELGRRDDEVEAARLTLAVIKAMGD